MTIPFLVRPFISNRLQLIHIRALQRHSVQAFSFTPYKKGKLNMGKYRNQLPQLSGEIFLTDGGTETYLIYKRGLELPHFSAFHLLDDPKGYEEVRQYFMMWFN